MKTVQITEIESVVPFLVPVISVTIWELKSFAAFIGPPFQLMQYYELNT